MAMMVLNEYFYNSFTSLQAIDDVYNISLKDRAKQIKERLVKEKIYKTRADNIMLGASQSILTKTSKKWQRMGQQGNNVKLLVTQALE